MTSKCQQNAKGNDISTNRKVFTGLLIILFVLPWPHGGELVWQYLLFSACIFSLAAIYLIKDINNKDNSFKALTSIKTPLILFGIWLLFQVLQVIPLPINLSAIKLLNLPEQNLNTNDWQTISIAPNVTLIELIKHTSYITIFILTLLLLNSKKRILILANTLFIGSAIIAFYSLINYYSNGAFDLIKSIPPWTVTWDKAVHGTFSYQNHYASFLTLTIPLGYGLLYRDINKKTYQKTKTNNLIKIIDLLMSINGLYLLSLLIMLTALFKTTSRGGNSIFFISIIITFFCMICQQNTKKKDKVIKTLLLIIGMTAIGITVFFTGISDSLTKKFERHGYAPSGRVLMHNTSFKIIKERPVLGTGAGTYPILQHIFKEPELGVNPMSIRAHNDYLELLTNQGIIGFSLLGSATLLLFMKLFKGLKKNRYDSTGSLYGLQVATFCSVTAILLHSIADFNFHLPVNAIYFYILLAIAIKIPLLNKTQNKSNQ
jgi:O-antigen ligase